MPKKVKRICLLDTVYPLFLYFLICGYNNEDIFIFSKTIPKPIRDNLSHFYFPKIQFYSGFLFAPLNSISGLLKNIKFYILYVFNIFRLRWFIFSKKQKYELEIYGHANTPFSFPFYELENSYLIEDGLGNYYNLKETPKKNIILEKILHFFGVYIYSAKEGYGTHENIKKIFLTKNLAPDIIKDKVELVNLHELWANKSQKEKTDILNVFNISSELLDKNSSAKVILLTEPFSEDLFIPFEEEIAIYKQIINSYSCDDIVIKTHPRETKDYRELFPDVQIIDTPFPIEIFNLLDIPMKKIITFCSSAALNISGCQIEVYNGEISSKEICEAREVLKKKLNN